jgi:GDPmannose 4,6-dehydratase
MKTALITGIAGQDGYHLSRLLIDKNYKVSGIVRNLLSQKVLDFKSAFPEVNLYELPTLTSAGFTQVFSAFSPQEIYNLAAISSVATSFENPINAVTTNGLGAVQLFESIRLLNAQKDVRFYQAGSSEMFGIPSESPQDEKTSFNPISPYGASKVLAHQIAVQYRSNFGFHISNGILYNHESILREESYVSRKITSSVTQIKLGNIKKFKLGNITSKRDWGYAGDYVRAMWMMLQAPQGNDYVVSTGISRSVRDFLTAALNVAGLTDEVEKYIDLDKSLARPADPNLLVGNSNKIREELGWKPSVTFEEMVEIMMENEMKIAMEVNSNN